MRNTLKQLHDKVFDECFTRFLQDAYCNDEAGDPLGDCEREYQAAIEYFSEHWSFEDREMLSDIEKLQAEKVRYAGEYAFYCGMNVAYEQFFIGGKELRFDFSKRLNRGLYEVQGMKGHPYYYQRTTQLREMYDALTKDRDEAECEHIVSHECGWDQRICSGAAAAYYLGYRAALAAIERVHPLATQNMIDQILALEYQMGITQSAAEREHHAEREATICREAG